MGSKVGCKSNVVSFVLSSPVGDLSLSCCSKAIHSLNLMRNPNKENFQPDDSISVVIKNASDTDKLDESNKVAQRCVQWLQKYFHQTKTSADTSQIPPICHFQGTANDSFRTKVWKTLTNEVKFGDKVSYGELAAMSGGTMKASRAVGQAMRTNPVILIIPCHRVVLSDGKIGNYASGKMNDVKEWLLRHEKQLD